MSDDLKLCPHCNQYVSRWTARRHEKYLTCVKQPIISTPLSRRRRRHNSSSSEDDEADLGVKQTLEHDDKDESDVVESGPWEYTCEEENGQEENSDNNDGVEEHWDEETEDDVNRDLSEDPKDNEKDQKDKARSITNWILCSLTYIQCKFNLSDKCIETLLLLFHQLFTVLGVVNTFCFCVATLFPVTLYMFRKFLQFDRDDFSKLIVCQNCTAVYRFSQVIQKKDGVYHISKCTNKIFGSKLPSCNNNKGKRGKYICEGELVQKILLNNREAYYPLKVFCYKNIINSLEVLLSRPDFIKECNKWRSRRNDKYFCDVYDGKVWQDFQTCDGQPLLSESNNFAAMINLDWFQPFKRRSDCSVGVIYLVFMNLPRSVRFKMENVCLLGIIPNLKKEPENLNSFMGPIIDELKVLSRGIQIQPEGKEPVTVKLHLLCASSDIPASRKLSGHMGHAAIKGCSFCEISFRDRNNKKYYGPVDAKWQARTRDKHIKHSNRARLAQTYTEEKMIQKETGYKFTKLLDLPYFKPSEFSVVEPMHNLFLGTAKRLFTTWIDKEFLSKKDLLVIGDRIQNMKVTSDIGRLPTNIASNHGHFTAEEWKNWVLLYSLYCLQGLLPEQHLKAWQKFVLACRIICQPAIPRSRLHIAHRLLLAFTSEMEVLYGSEFLTPNIHLHGHLKETIENYGSLYGFWAFSFERYNGILADFPTNKRSIEIQIMRRFQKLGFSVDLKYRDLGDDLNDKFLELQKNVPDLPHPSCDILTAPHVPLAEIEQSVWQDLSCLSIKHTGYKLMTLSNDEQNHLLTTYKKMYTDEEIQADDLTRVSKKYPTVVWNKEVIGSTSSGRRGNSSLIMAKWAADDSSIDDLGIQRPGIVRHYMLHTAKVNNQIRSHLFAVIDWYKTSESQRGYLQPLSVWSTKQMNDGPATFLPVQRIHARCAVAREKHGSHQFLVIAASPPQIYI